MQSILLDKKDTMKIIQYIFLFSLILPSMSRPCAGLFSRSKTRTKTIKTQKFIQKIFSHPANATEYQGKEGCVRFAERYYKHLRMDVVFSRVSAVLPRSEFKALAWRVYQGYTDEFRAERNRILGSDGQVKKEYQGMEGYVLYADKHYSGRMRKTFVNVSAVLSREEKDSLDWKNFAGDTPQYKQLIDYFKKHSFEDYQGAVGQRRVAKLIFKGNLQQTYENVSTLRHILFDDKNEFDALRAHGWSVILR